tara:strand:+ start:2393 stop:2602 length:210 start_codon:yes stop_codon:yes gene_type:complete
MMSHHDKLNVRTVDDIFTLEDMLRKNVSDLEQMINEANKKIMKLTEERNAYREQWKGAVKEYRDEMGVS